MKLTEDEILSKMTPKGGWTRETLESWGVPWPPPKGWKKALLAGAVLPRRPLAPEVVALVKAARRIVFGDDRPEAHRALEMAYDAFASDVPLEGESAPVAYVHAYVCMDCGQHYSDPIANVCQESKP